MNKSNEQIEIEAINYLKETKDIFFKTYLKKCEPLETKTAIFTAGSSGSGKTEFAEYILEIEANFIHLDIDSIREYFTPLGYDGSNSKLFQKPSSWGVHFLFDEAVKKRNLSIIMDSNFSSLTLAKRNIKSLLKRGYNIEIYYIYDDLKNVSYIQKKEKLLLKELFQKMYFLIV